MKAFLFLTKQRYQRMLEYVSYSQSAAALAYKYKVVCVCVCVMFIHLVCVYVSVLRDTSNTSDLKHQTASGFCNSNTRCCLVY